MRAIVEGGEAIVVEGGFRSSIEVEISQIVVERAYGVSVAEAVGEVLGVELSDPVRADVELEFPSTIAVETIGHRMAFSPESLVFEYSGEDLVRVTGETFVRTLTYDGDERLATVHDSDTGTTGTLSYDDDGRVIGYSIG